MPTRVLAPKAPCGHAERLHRAQCDSAPLQICVGDLTSWVGVRSTNCNSSCLWPHAVNDDACDSNEMLLHLAGSSYLLFEGAARHQLLQGHRHNAFRTHFSTNDAVNSSWPRCQPSFDPTYDTDPMESFVPLVTEVFDRKPFWWEPADKKEEELDCKARLAFGYSLDARNSVTAN